MKIKSNVVFKALCSYSGLNESELSTNIINELTKAGVWVEDPELRGSKIFDIAEAYELDLENIILTITRTKKPMNALLMGASTLLGNGDCQRCGGELEYKNESEMLQFDFDSEPYQSGAGYYECEHCKTKTKR